MSRYFNWRFLWYFWWFNDWRLFRISIAGVSFKAGITSAWSGVVTSTFFGVEVLEPPHPARADTVKIKAIIFFMMIVFAQCTDLLTGIV